jgi:hypothetical protein
VVDPVRMKAFFDSARFGVVGGTASYRRRHRTHHCEPSSFSWPQAGQITHVASAQELRL